MGQKKFLSGFLSGVASCVLIFGVVTAGTRLGWFDSFLSSGISDSISVSEDKNTMSKLNLLKKYIDTYYLNDLDADDYAEGLFDGLIASLDDPYAAYYTKEEYDSVKESTEGKYVGIGAYVSYDDTLETAIIVKPYADGPADKAGIKAGDYVITIDGEDVTGKELDDIVALMKGEEGTKVTVGVVSEGDIEDYAEDDIKEYEITREELETTTVVYQMLDNNIGYIAISSFKDSTVEQFCDAIDKLLDEGMEGVIFDVRDNGGGSLSAVIDMCDRLLPEGVIVSTKDKNGEGQEYKSTDEESLDLPMVLLVNGNSASASEVFAGALKDYDVATLVGVRTFGKGIVQTIFSLNDGSAVKLTTSKYYTPNGNNIHEKGINPDIEIEMDEDFYSLENPTEEDDNQLQAAISCMNEKLGIK